MGHLMGQLSPPDLCGVLQGVKPKLTAHPGQHLKQEAKSSDTIGYALTAL